MRDDAMMRFSIAPANGGWRWKTIDQDGRASHQGLVPTKALAAALIIRDIIREASAGQREDTQTAA